MHPQAGGQKKQAHQLATTFSRSFRLSPRDGFSVSFQQANGATRNRSNAGPTRRDSDRTAMSVLFPAVNRDVGDLANPQCFLTSRPAERRRGIT